MCTAGQGGGVWGRHSNLSSRVWEKVNSDACQEGPGERAECGRRASSSSLEEMNVDETCVQPWMLSNWMWCKCQVFVNFSIIQGYSV